MCDTSEKICIGFIGLGLIGGSIAKTLRKVHPEYKLMAYCRTKATIEEAIQEGVIDIALEERDDRFADCDYIFLCAPVSTNISYLPFVKGIAKPGCIITDVGSVKGEIHQAVETLGMTHQFIGGHPMAGSEKTGYSSATDYLLENAYYMITPGPDLEIATVSAFVDLVQSLKAIPMVLTYEEHDYITAGVSHLPHIIASSLVNLINKLDNEAEYMKTIAAGGFRDITRIASSSPVMWEQICIENHENISSVLDEYIRMLIQIRCSIDNQEASYLYDMFARSRDYRDSIDASSSGLINKTYMLYIDIVDEAGGIATIATILAMEGISIKNIGIIHNREFEQGVLKIEFYEQNALEKGCALLKKRNYIVYER